jgi:uncharacterized protein YcbK (DUF882 family)
MPPLHVATCFALLGAVLSVTAAAGGHPALPLDRYFASGDGEIRLTNAKDGARERVRYRLPDGTYPPAAAARIDRLFGIPERSADHISARLVSLLDHLEDRYGQAIVINSGYRSPQYNEGLRSAGRLAAKASLHTEGLAADIVLGKALAPRAFAYIKGLKCCGVGYYHGGSLHVDSGPSRYWDEATSGVYTPVAEHNKKIMLSTDRDIYLPGEAVVLQLARITDYPLGISAQVELLQDERIVTHLTLDGARDTDCIPVADRPARIVRATLPADLVVPPGRYALRLALCAKPYPETPDGVVSNTVALQPKP